MAPTQRLCTRCKLMLRDAEMTACLLFLWYDISLRFILTRPYRPLFRLFGYFFGITSLELTLGVNTWN